MWKQNGRKKAAVPSSNLTVCYWKWPFIVELPIENGDFSIAMLVYQRVMKSEHARETLSVRLFVWPLHETVIYLPNHLMKYHDVDNKSSDVIFSSRFTSRRWWTSSSESPKRLLEMCRWRWSTMVRWSIGSMVPLVKGLIKFNIYICLWHMTTIIIYYKSTFFLLLLLL